MTARDKEGWLQQKEENHKRREDDAPELGTRRKSERNKERKTLWLVPSPPPFVPATRGRRRRRVTTSFRRRDVAEKQNKTSPRSLLLDTLAARANATEPVTQTHRYVGYYWGTEPSPAPPGNAEKTPLSSSQTLTPLPHSKPGTKDNHQMQKKRKHNSKPGTKRGLRNTEHRTEQQQ